MEAKWLDDFIALAEAQSFTRAAQESHCSQSALSRRIQSLERWIGAQLIDRDAYPMRLTPAGQRFLEVSKGLKGTLEAARLLGRNNSRPGQDARLTIALSSDVSPEKTAQLFSRIADAIPGARVSLASCAAPQALSALLEGKADLGLLCQYARIPHIIDGTAFEQQTVDRDCLKLFCCGAPEQAAHLPLLGYDVSSHLAQVCALALAKLRRDVNLDCICEASTPQSLLAMVRKGLGVALLPESIATAQPGSGALWEMDADCRAELSLVLVRPLRDTRRTNPRAAQKLSDRVWDLFA